MSQITDDKSIKRHSIEDAYANNNCKIVDEEDAQEVPIAKKFKSHNGKPNAQKADRTPVSHIKFCSFQFPKEILSPITEITFDLNVATLNCTKEEKGESK